MAPNEIDENIESQSLRWRSVFGIALDIICISLWLGGLVIIGAVVAPVAFHVVRSLPWLYLSPNEQNTLAGAIIGGSLRVFNFISYVAGIILVIRTLVRLHAPWFIARLAMILICLATSFALGMGYFPAMDAAQAAGAMPRFDALHHQYELIAQAQMILLALFTVAYARSVAANGLRS